MNTQSEVSESDTPEGQIPSELFQLNLGCGGGLASYAKVNGVWYSVNMHGNKVQDVRWTATLKEVEALNKRRATANR